MKSVLMFLHIAKISRAIGVGYRFEDGKTIVLQNKRFCPGLGEKPQGYADLPAAGRLRPALHGALRHR